VGPERPPFPHPSSRNTEGTRTTVPASANRVGGIPWGANMPEATRTPSHRRFPEVTLIHLLSFLVAGAAGSAVAFNVLGRSRCSREGATRAGIITTMVMVRNYNQEEGGLPPSFDALVPKYMEKIPLDAWRRPLVYRLEPDGGATVLSYGEDGLPGGRGRSADLWERLTPAKGAARADGRWVQTGDSEPMPR
jgi:hypothetical protein